MTRPQMPIGARGYSAGGGRLAEDEQQDEGDGPGSEQGEAGDPGDVAAAGGGKSYQVDRADSGHDRGAGDAGGGDGQADRYQGGPGQLHRGEYPGRDLGREAGEP